MRLRRVNGAGSVLELALSTRLSAKGVALGLTKMERPPPIKLYSAGL